MLDAEILRHRAALALHIKRLGSNGPVLGILIDLNLIQLDSAEAFLRK